MIRLSPIMLSAELEVLSPTEGTDEYGNVTVDFSQPAKRWVRGHVQPGTSDETTASRLATEVVSTVFTLDPIEARDRVRYNGETWEVDGHSKNWGDYCSTVIVLRKG